MNEMPLERFMVTVDGVDLFVRHGVLASAHAVPARPLGAGRDVVAARHMVYVDNPSEFDPAFDAWLAEAL